MPDPAFNAPRALWWCPVMVVAAAFAGYANTFSVPFFFDDPVAILENPTIRNLAAMGDVLSPPNNGSGVTGRPLVNLSLALNHALGGMAPAGYHFANILFHALAGLALLGAVRRTLLLPVLSARFGTVAQPVALASAVLWVLHPLQTESVTCVIQRTELLVGLFYFATLHCAVRVMETGSRAWTALAVAAALAGMASKEVMVTAPFLVLLHDRTFAAGSFAEAWRRRSGLYAGLFASLGLLAWLVLGAGGTRGEAAGFGVGVAWWSYALKQCEAIWLYLKLTLWPHPLVLYYGTDVVTDPLAVWPQLIGIVALVAGTLWALWRRPALGFLGMWTLGILAPSSSVVPLVSQTVSEHRMYLPIAAPIALGAAMLFLVVGRRAGFILATIAVLFGGVTLRRNTDYRSELAIWTDTVAKVPANARARNNLGDALGLAGRGAEALAQFRAALALDPNSAESHYNIATALIAANRHAEAVAHAEAAVRLKPRFANAHNNLGLALLSTGRTAEGVAAVRRALEIKPDIPEAHCNLAGAANELGDSAAAAEHAHRALALRPGMPLALFHLVNARLRLNQPAFLIQELEAVIRAQPRNADALSNLAAVLYQTGRAAEAIPHYEASLRVRASAATRTNLAGALFQAGRAEEAVAQYRAAAQAQPDYFEAHANLGLVLAQLGRVAEARAAYEAALRLKPDDARAKDGLARLRAP